MSLCGLYDYTFRLVIIGECSVGKTTLTNMLTTRRSTETYEATIGVDYGSIIIKLKDNARIKCQIWDTAGQETFAPLITSYYKDIAGTIMLFDVSNRKSFNRIPFWLNEFNKHTNSEVPIPILLIGNKIDIYNRKVSTEEASSFAKKNGLIYEEISVKKNINVYEPINLLCEKIYENKDSNPGIKVLNDLSLKLKDINNFDKSRYNYDCCKIS